MRWFVITMAISLIFTILLGIFMAFKFGHKRTAIGCLLGGIIIPVLLVLIALLPRTSRVIAVPLSQTPPTTQTTQ